jgi:hypothetical protein
LLLVRLIKMALAAFKTHLTIPQKQTLVPYQNIEI